MSFVVRRCLTAIPVIIGISTITFFLIHFVPGDPVDLMLGEQASSIDKSALRASLSLDLPLGEQYLKFISGLTRFDLGRSLHDQHPVTKKIGERLPATLELTMAAMFFALIFGIPLGVFAAVKRSTHFDGAVRALSLFGTSAPSFWTGPLLVSLFAIKLGWLPVSERGGFDHLLLPAITLSIALSAVLMQITRTAVLRVIKEDYIRTARAKGASAFKLYFKHALANAALPLITVIGLQFGALLTGTIIVETIFDWPGLGTLLFQAISQRDYPLIQGCVLTIAFIYVCVNLATDLAFAAANPQVRIS